MRRATEMRRAGRQAGEPEPGLRLLIYSRAALG